MLGHSYLDTQAPLPLYYLHSKGSSYQWSSYQSKVIHAGGEAQASEKLAEAANIISVYPAAIQLRFLQTLTEVSTEKNSTMIVPLPLGLLTAFMQRKEKE